MTKAAGVLFISINGNALFLRRTETAADCAGCWDFPGGTQEGDERPEETAVREAREEIGLIPDGNLLFHTRTRSGIASPLGAVGLGVPLPAQTPVAGGAPAVLMPPDVDFTTFLMKVTNEFVPELNDEHDGFCWAPVDAPPEPLHPGCRIALARLSMNELGIAEAIRDGQLVSPQKYENMWLWAIRLTGTGVSYRPKHDEFVKREAEHHLTPRALARYNGLPVIMNHPAESPLLNSKEFSDRIVGTIFLPYVAGDEAWGIAKIFDDDANALMLREDLSTSPGVGLQGRTVDRVLRLEDGSKVLLEGDPRLIDHVAICEVGVWDKGGDPSGIRSETREDSAMTEEEKKAAEEKAKKDAAEVEEKAKKDAAEKEKADGEGAGFKQLDGKLTEMLDSMKGISGRLDALEGEKAKTDAAKKDGDMDMTDKARKDEEDKKAAEDKAKKDAADKEKADTDEKEKSEKEKMDAATRRDSIDKRISTVEDLLKTTAGMVTPLSDDDHQQLADAWTRADNVYTALGKPTPRAMPGETSARFRRRIALDLKPFSPTWKEVDITGKAFADDAGFKVVEGQILDQAAQYARSPATAQPGKLREVKSRLDSGHVIKEFVGNPRDWMNEFAGEVQLRGEGRFFHQLGNHSGQRPA